MAWTEISNEFLEDEELMTAIVDSGFVLTNKREGFHSSTFAVEGERVPKTEGKVIMTIDKINSSTKEQKDYILIVKCELA